MDGRRLIIGAAGAAGLLPLVGAAVADASIAAVVFPGALASWLIV